MSAIFPNIAGALAVRNALTAAALNANTDGVVVDTSDLEGNLLAVVNSAAASASDTLDVTINESYDGSTNWTAVPADALFVPDTGVVGTFAQITASAASFQQLGIVKERVIRYLRLTFTVAGAAISIPCSAAIIGAKKYV